MQNFDHYQLKKLINRNRLKAVYQAMDLNNAENVAVKTWKIAAEEGVYQPDVERFMRIMKAFVAFDHPQILPILNFGEMNRLEKGITGNYLYAAMPRYTEPALEQWIQETHSTEPLSLTIIANIIIEIANILQEVHNKKLMHLGLKPSNILVLESDEKDGQPEFMLTGFEGASFANEPRNSYMESDTLHYIAPEQWEGRTVAASDQYALAMIAYELLAGEKVTEYENKQEPPYTQPKGLKLAPLSRRNARLSSVVDEVITKGLARTPEERYASISEFAITLQKAIQLSERRSAETINKAPNNKNGAKSNNTHILLGITETEAQQGTTFPIVLAGGQRIAANIPGGSHAGQTIRVAMGDGSSASGTLIVTLAVRPDPAGNHHILEGMSNGNRQIVEELTNLASEMKTITQKTTKTGASESDALMLQRLALISSKLDEISDETSNTPLAGLGDMPRYLNKRKGPIIMCIVLILTMFLCSTQLSSSLRGIIVTNGNSNIQAITTSNAKIVVSATAQHFAGITATALAQVKATATQQNNINLAAESSTIPKPYGIISDSTHFYNPNGQLILADLENKTSSAQWNQQNIDNNHQCFFGSSDIYYHAVMNTTAKPITMCTTSGNGGNVNTGAQFVLQVQMGIVSGDEGGIAFNLNNGGYYYFDLLQSGEYNIGSNGTPFTNGTGKTDAFIKGTSPNQFNLLGIVGNHNTLTFYINLQPVFTISGVSYGDNGDLAAIANDTNDSTSIQFQNLKLWHY